MVFNAPHQWRDERVNLKHVLYIESNSINSGCFPV